ncbi:hypothetical protein TraAM80_00146 [Trypanosoma rangeli]|uniref:Calponin-homology (CH) domain-containing protein n=1 Tax=Trypanosoma rangeli TaxID=5698 RepID=A0A3R7NW91_TRYRA|nr:uncharacterized protein TraAM80_00146 [Trypanosoma rangeli]RNF12790.1 hypothetical protein TraAM80_00146 [Trypanosoma rangeli]|eukprot:RNF12790.1 hypothetical protein TraAM80_00146 [Trypanosoma rangeli]
MADAAKKASLLLFVRQVLAREKACTKGGMQTMPETYEDLGDGAFLYRILACISPETFPDAAEIAEQAESSRQNRVVRKGNLVALVQHMDDYVHRFLDAPDTLSLTLTLRPADIANLTALSGELKAPLTSDVGIDSLMELTDIFLVIVVLSGNPIILQAVKSLPHADQVALSNAAKACVTKYALRPRRRHETLTLGNSAPSSPYRGVTIKRSEPSFHSGLCSSPVVDEAAFTQEISQLRRELDDANAKVVELDAKLHLTITEKQEWESRYKNLLAEAELGRTAAAGEDHLRQLLAKKENVVQKLTATIEEHQKRISAFKEATAAQEAALGSFKRKLKHTEEELMRKNVERREALDKLSVAEESLSAQRNARTELERQLEDMRTELALLKAECPNSMDHGEVCSNRSFGSMNSIDRVVQLENELDEARSQKEAAERLLHVLQRQVAPLPAEGLKTYAAVDALKAQLRQAEKEKGDLRNQLAATIAKLEDAQSHRRGYGSTSATDSETESLLRGGKLSGREVESLSERDVTEAFVQQIRPCENQDGMHRERTLLGSTLLLFGYRNLMLQQRAMLTNSSSFTVSGDEEDKSSGSVWTTGSFLTRHRHEVEQGLSALVLNRGS